MTECLVLPGIAGLAVQFLLFASCIAVFYYKRKRESVLLGADARSREEFYLDASKQFIGAGWLHIMNLWFAGMLNGLTQDGDQCEWYWINIMVDTTLGTAVAYFCLQVAMTFIRKKMDPQAAGDYKPGEYRDEEGIIDMSKYFKQLGVWLAVVSSMKILMVMFMFLFSGVLLGIAGFVLAPFLLTPFLKLVVVMIAVPILMDAFQIWMIDSFLKKKPSFAAEGELLQDAEAGSVYVEAAADALMACSHRCEETLTEETLLVVKAKVGEAIQGVVDPQDYPVKPRGAAEMWSPNTKYESQDINTPQANFETHPHLGGGNFQTQLNSVQKFETMIPPDQAKH